MVKVGIERDSGQASLPGTGSQKKWQRDGDAMEAEVVAPRRSGTEDPGAGT